MTAVRFGSNFFSSVEQSMIWIAACCRVVLIRTGIMDFLSFFTGGGGGMTRIGIFDLLVSFFTGGGLSLGSGGVGDSLGSVGNGVMSGSVGEGGDIRARRVY